MTAALPTQAARETTAWENPMGLMGFEFVEFTSPQPGLLEDVFEKLGFTLVARHRSKDVLLYRQNQINFILNREPHSQAAYFGAEHGPSACGLAFRVKDAHRAYKRALELGAQPIEIPTGPMELRLPAIKGIGGAPLYLIDRFEDGKSIYDIDFEWLEGVPQRPEGHGLKEIDHLTHNVYRGRMGFWANFYEKLFNFREIRYFDIQGEYTGLTSKAMTAPDGRIRIPLNEEARQGGGQIEEFLMQFNGEGIQHIALVCDRLTDVVDRLGLAGVPLAPAPNDVYYEMLDKRLPGHGQDVAALQARGILLDGSTAGGQPRLLLQIFSTPMLGPVFFEFIQREGDEGFGEGNFKALFESLERDQVNRGVIDTRAKGDDMAVQPAVYGASERPPRGDYTRARDDYTCAQDWAAYTAQDHDTYHRLYLRQSAQLPGLASEAFIAALPLLGAKERIPRFDDVNERLYRATRWQLVAVPGLIPEVPFFRLLAARKFPVTDWIRRPEEFEYIVEPDVFHDLFGHVPLLFNPVLADYMQRYGEGGLKAARLGACEMLARLYWYTIEFGLIREAAGLRAYGAGILSSHGELPYSVRSPEPQRLPLSLERAMRTRYKIDSYQQTYFVIDGFEQLFDLTAQDFEPLYARLRGLPEFAAGAG